MAGAETRIAAIEAARNAGDFDRAERLCRQALRQFRDNTALVALGVSLAIARRDWPRARALLGRAVRLLPDTAGPWRDLGVVLLALGENAEAANALDRAVSIEPEAPMARLNLALARRRAGDFGGAEAALADLVALDPDFARGWNNLGTLRLAMGDIPGAVAALDRAAALPDASPRVASNRLLAATYRDDLDDAALFAAHRDWGAAFAATDTTPAPPRTARAAGARLRVGLLSPDLRRHSVAFFVEPLLRAWPRARLEAFAYADVTRPDATTARIEALAEHWRPVAGLDNDALTQAIRDDGIDILIDLAGHTWGERVAVFAGRAAPLQLTWLGYPHSTGLPQMDFRLVDAVTDPRDYAAALSTERLLRLPGCFLCYAPPDEAPAIAPPAARDGIVFGSFNNIAKLGEATLALWARVLAAVPDSRLLLKAQSLDDATVRDRLTARFAAHGVAAGRLDLRGRVDSLAGHFATYNEVDIALDTTPYCGTTTSCEALWMGVPVITLAGRRHAARVGASLLHHAGLPDLVAATADEFVAIAAGLATDAPRRAGLRTTMRDRLAGSPLMDTGAFATGFADTLAAAWAAP